LTIDEIVVETGTGDAGGDATEQQQQMQTATVVQGSQLRAQRQTAQALNIRMNRLEQQQVEHHQQQMAAIGGVRGFMSQSVSTITKEMKTLRIQPQRQLYHNMFQRHGNNPQYVQQPPGTQNPLAAVGGATINGGGAGGLGPTGGGHDPRRPLRQTLAGNRMPLLSARLGKPKDLNDLWTEWTHGIGGNKPARDFTDHERGAVKDKFTLRKPFWECVQRHVNAGESAAMTITKIYQAYGPGKGVTYILRRFREDKGRGGHPSLRI
jgi:hypothetical protein